MHLHDLQHGQLSDPHGVAGEVLIVQVAGMNGRKAGKQRIGGKRAHSSSLEQAIQLTQLINHVLASMRKGFMAQYLTLLPTHSHTHSLTHSHTHSLNHSLTRSLIHPLTHLLTNKLNHSLAD